MNTLTLIKELQFINSSSYHDYIEEFDMFNMPGAFKTLASMLPGIGTFNTWQCLKRTNLGFIRKTFTMIMSIPLGMMAYISCVLHSSGEVITASKLNNAMTLFEEVLVSFQMAGLFTNELDVALNEFQQSFEEKGKYLRAKYPAFNKELEREINIEYGQLALDYVEGYIAIISKMLYRKLNNEQKAKLNEIKNEIKMSKMEFNKFKK